MNSLLKSQAEQTICPTPSWHRLEPTREAEHTLIPLEQATIPLSPAWKMFLWGDGSPTRHLQLLTGEPVEVDVIDMSLIGENLDGAPDLIQEVPGPRLRRQVWLRTASGERLAYATSWWEASHVDEYLQNRALPIWSSLGHLRTELYRDIREVHYGHSATLEQAFDYPDPFWGRYYLFWHHSQPLTLIYEVFSPHLTKYLGPIQPVDQ